MTQTHGDRAFVLVEHFLELFGQDRAGQVALRLLRARVFELKHNEAVDVEGVGVCRARCSGAQEAFTGLFASGCEFAFCPVTHELEACFALNDHRGGQVPVATIGSAVGIAFELLESFQHLGRRGALQGFRIQFHQRIVVVFRTANAQRHRLKHSEVLPVLTAMRQSHST